MLDSSDLKTHQSFGAVNKVVLKPSKYTICIPLKGKRTLAYNTVSQAFAVWNSEDIALWENLCAAETLAFEPSYRPFVQGGFVVNTERDEFNALKQAYEKQRNDNSHLMMTIAPTLSCNFACHYCFQGLDKPLTKMTKQVRETTKGYLLDQMEGRRSVSMVWYGGEPLMDQTTIFELSDVIIEKCNRDNIRYSATMISNGYNMTPPVAEKLKKARVSTVQITIDGDAESHDDRRHLTSGRGTFDKIISNIKAVAEKRLLRISIRVNIDGDNEDTAERLMQVLVENGLGVHNGISVYFAPVEAVAEASGGGCESCMSKNTYAETEMKLMQKAFELGLNTSPKPMRFMGLCTATKPNSYVIVPNGDLHKCWDTVMDPSRRVGSIFGSVRRNDTITETAWNTWTPFDNPVCASCKILPNCAGACAFKFVHSDYTSGEAAELPCPSLKFNLAEQLFMRARIAGFVTEDDWEPDHSPTLTQDRSLTGERHSSVSMSTISSKLRESITAGQDSF